MRTHRLKLILISLLMLPVVLAQSQTVSNLLKHQSNGFIEKPMAPQDSVEDIIFSEDFTDGACPPADWEVTPAGNTNWVISETNYAGGTADEGKFYYFPVFNGTTRMISPLINTIDFSSMELEFKHYLSGAGKRLAFYQLSISLLVRT